METEELKHRTLRYLCGPESWIAGDCKIFVELTAEWEDGGTLWEPLLLQDCKAVRELFRKTKKVDLTNWNDQQCEELFESAESAEGWQVEAVEMLLSDPTKITSHECAIYSLWSTWGNPSMVARKLGLETYEVENVLEDTFDVCPTG